MLKCTSNNLNLMEAMDVETRKKAMRNHPRWRHHARQAGTPTSREGKDGRFRSRTRPSAQAREKTGVEAPSLRHFSQGIPLPGYTESVRESALLTEAKATKAKRRRILHRPAHMPWRTMAESAGKSGLGVAKTARMGHTRREASAVSQCEWQGRTTPTWGKLPERVSLRKGQ